MAGGSFWLLVLGYEINASKYSRWAKLAVRMGV